MAQNNENWLWVFRAGVGLILTASLLFLMGFSTTKWHKDGHMSWGLWKRCDGAHCTSWDSDDLHAYFVATQAFQIMAVACYGLAPIVHFFFYCSKNDKRPSWKNRIFDVGYSFGVVFHMSSILIFGIERPSNVNIAWSYQMSAAASAIATIGIFLCIISRRKALRKFKFVQKKNRIDTRGTTVVIINNSKNSTPRKNNDFSSPTNGIQESTRSPREVRWVNDRRGQQPRVQSPLSNPAYPQTNQSYPQANPSYQHINSSYPHANQSAFVTQNSGAPQYSPEYSNGIQCIIPIPHTPLPNQRHTLPITTRAPHKHL